MNLFDITSVSKKLEELENKTLEPNFWEDSKLNAPILQEIKILKDKKESYFKVFNEVNNLIEMNELLEIEFDNDLMNELFKNTNELTKNTEKLEIATLLSGKYDSNNAIITLHPGAGGTESQDWAEMLYRMYSRWANKNGFTVKELDYLDGEEAGLKSVTALVEGPYAYGYLKGEMGVHR